MTFIRCLEKYIEMRYLFLISCLLLFFMDKGMSQKPQLAGVSYIFYPNSGLKDDAREVEFTFQEFGAFIKIPFRFKNEKTIMVNGLDYAILKSVVSNTSVNYTGENSEKLQFMTFQTIIAHKLRDDLNIVLSLRPTIASDFEEKLSSDDFVLQGFLFMSKKKSENLSIGLGIAHTMRLGKTFVIPIVPFHLEMNKHSINAILPVKFDYAYSMDNKERFKIGFRETVNGGNINITAASDGNSNYPEIDKINYSRINMGPVISYNITKHIQIEALGGISLRRRYNLLDVEDNTQKMSLKETPFFQLGMYFTPSKIK